MGESILKLSLNSTDDYEIFEYDELQGEKVKNDCISNCLSELQDSPEPEQYKLSTILNSAKFKYVKYELSTSDVSLMLYDEIQQREQKYDTLKGKYKWLKKEI